MNKLCPLFCLFTLVTAAPTPPHAEPTSVCSSSAGECTASSTTPRSSVYVIGDLHGDVHCAVSWVNRTGLVRNLFHPAEANNSSSELHRRLNPSHQWTWNSDNDDDDVSSSLIFMGDYVDKGPTSLQTIRFVRDLTLRFPSRVTALLGNHELELLRDRDGRIEPMRRYASLSYAAVHPAEYRNYIDNDNDSDNADDNGSRAATTKHPRRPLDDSDDRVLDLLYRASMEVYSRNAHDAVRFVPSVPDNDHYHAITDMVPEEQRGLVRERLEEYQDRYLGAYRSGTVLGRWLESRPIVHLDETVDTLFVHGGIHPDVGRRYLNRGKESVQTLNSVWREHSAEDNLYDFLNTNATHGRAVYSLLTHRGNHPGYSHWESRGDVDDDAEDADAVCVELNSTLSNMPGVNRIAVGHTPDFRVRLHCRRTFLALDSMLGRGIRAVGNEYCPWHGHDTKGIPKVSRNGRYRCDDIPGICQGEIVRLDSDGSIHILKL